MRTLTLFLFFIITGLGIALQSADAQSDTQCPAFVEQTMTQVNDFCSGLGRNSACYGNYDVDASFYADAPITNFSAPSDQVPLASLQTIRTAPLDETNERWGIALLNMQANLPMSVPGQNVVMLLVGDVEVTNQITPEQLTYTGETVTINTLSDSVYYEEPSLVSRVIGEVATGSILEADLLSEDGLWARIPQPAGEVLWIRSRIVDNITALATLSNSPLRHMSPMQSFYFSAGIGQSNCSQASGTVFIQGPNNIRVDLEVNGAEISIGSTIALNYTSDNEIQVTTLSGTAYVEGIALPAGQSMTAQVDENNFIRYESWTAPVTQEDVQLDRFEMSEAIPEALLHYQIHLPGRVNQNANAGGNGNNGNNGNSDCPGNSCNSNGNNGNGNANGNSDNANCPGNSCNSNGNNGGGNGNANGNSNNNGNNGNGNTGNGNCGNGNGNGNGNGC